MPPADNMGLISVSKMSYYYYGGGESMYLVETEAYVHIRERRKRHGKIHSLY